MTSIYDRSWFGRSWCLQTCLDHSNFTNLYPCIYNLVCIITKQVVQSRCQTCLYNYQEGGTGFVIYDSFSTTIFRTYNYPTGGTVCVKCDSFVQDVSYLNVLCSPVVQTCVYNYLAGGTRCVLCVKICLIWQVCTVVFYKLVSAGGTRCVLSDSFV